MLAVLAFIAFVVAIILFLVGHSFVLAALIGAALVAAHLAYPYTPYDRRRL